MRCQDCGHDYTSGLARCPRCARLNPRRARNGTQSRLIEFPVPPRNQQQRNPPAWRAELSEKVKAVRARKDAEAAAASKQIDLHPKAEIPAETPSLVAPPNSDSDRLVEAALVRVRRASSRSDRVESPRPAAEREATARVLLPAIDPPAPSVEPANPFRRISTPRAVPRASATGSADEALRENLPEITVEPVVDEVVAAIETTLGSLSEAPAAPIVIIENDPLDYLAAEVRKVDKVLESQLERKPSASLLSHVIAALVDLFAIAVASAPFVVVVAMSGGNFADWGTRTAIGVIVGAVSFFYLSLTHCFCARTFGMMVTNTRIVDIDTFEPPGTGRAVLRCIGYFIAIVPAGLGLLWAAIDAKHRGWHDLLAETVVITDY